MPDWKSRQIEYWNHRALTGKGTGKVPYRKIEMLFVAYWIHGSRILDAGCGLGEVMKHLRNHNSKLTLTGFDLSEEMVIQAGQCGLDVFQSDITKIKAMDKHFDTTIAIRAIKNVLNLKEQRNAIMELARVSAKRVIVIDSIKESQVKSPSYNLYISRNWLVDTFLQEGFNLLWEEYFLIPKIDYPILASSRKPTLGSDEGFYVFDREMGEGLKMKGWRFLEVKYSAISIIKTLVRKAINSRTHLKNRF